MYVWQMNDGRWHISIKTGVRGLFAAILQNKAAFKLFDRSYEYQRDADAAERQIRDLIRSA